MDSFLSADVNREVKNLPRKERENLRQRGEILQAALKLFSEKRYHNVSMHEIAKEAEFGIGTLYKFFANKEDLYKALIMEGAQKWHHAVLQDLAHEQDPISAIKRQVVLRQQLFLDHLPLVRLYFAETKGARFHVKAGFDQDFLRLHDEYMEKLASVFERGIKEKVFRSLDPYQMALVLDGIINAFLFQILEDPARFRKKDKLSTAADIFFKGVLNK